MRKAFNLGHLINFLNHSGLLDSSTLPFFRPSHLAKSIPCGGQVKRRQTLCCR
jgi:hypothetical protein